MRACVICRRGPDTKRPLEGHTVDGVDVAVCAQCVGECYSETLEDTVRRRLAEARA